MSECKFSARLQAVQAAVEQTQPIAGEQVLNILADTERALKRAASRAEELKDDWDRISIAQMRGPTVEATARLLAETSFTEKRNGLEMLLEIYETRSGALIAVTSSTLPGGEGKEDARVAVVEPSDDPLAMRLAVMDHFNWENRARAMVRKLGWSLVQEVA